MNTLRKLLEDREHVYVTHTKAMFDLYGEKIAKTFSYLLNIDRHISWVALELYGDCGNLITVTGMLHYKKGDVVRDLDGSEKVLDSDKYQRKVKAMFLVDSLEHNQPRELCEEVKRFFMYENELSPQELHRIFNNPKFKGFIDMDTRDIDLNDNEFDYDKLSDEQKESVLIFNTNDTQGKLN